MPSCGYKARVQGVRCWHCSQAGRVGIDVLTMARWASRASRPTRASGWAASRRDRVRRWCQGLWAKSREAFAFPGTLQVARMGSRIRAARAGSSYRPGDEHGPAQRSSRSRKSEGGAEGRSLAEVFFLDSSSSIEDGNGNGVLQYRRGRRRALVRGVRSEYQAIVDVVLLCRSTIRAVTYYDSVGQAHRGPPPVDGAAGRGAQSRAAWYPAEKVRITVLRHQHRPARA